MTCYVTSCPVCIALSKSRRPIPDLPVKTRVLHEATDRDEARAATELDERRQAVANHLDTLDNDQLLMVLDTVARAEPDAVIDALNETGHPLP